MSNEKEIILKNLLSPLRNYTYNNDKLMNAIMSLKGDNLTLENELFLVDGLLEIHGYLQRANNMAKILNTHIEKWQRGNRESSMWKMLKERM